MEEEVDTVQLNERFDHLKESNNTMAEGIYHLGQEVDELKKNPIQQVSLASQ